MPEKLFLRRKMFAAVSYACIVLCLALIIDELLKTQDKIAVRAAVSVYNIGVACALYICNIRHVSIDTLLLSIYLCACNACVLVCIVFVRFLLYFDSHSPYSVLFASVPMLVVAMFSLSTGIFVMIVRKYIMQGLVSPISVQRQKGIESAIVVVRREYPEIFQ